MHILIVSNTVIPVNKYGGIERIIWWLGKALVNKGHKVTYMVEQGSYCNFANVVYTDYSRHYSQQIPDDVDVVHYHSVNDNATKKPFIVTEHGNYNDVNRLYDYNTVFVSKNHAERFGSNAFVHNGLDFDDYAKPNWNIARNCFHFLGDAAWKVKNVTGAIKITKQAKQKLAVLGGTRFNFNMGIRLTFDAHVKFYGKVGGLQKSNLLNKSKGLIFPVLWHEPFGLAIIESMYYGCPVFGTTYGSLPELVNTKVGFLSNSYTQLINAVKNVNDFDKKICSNYVVDNFSANKMTDEYIKYYQMVLNGEKINATQPQLIQSPAKFLPIMP